VRSVPQASPTKLGQDWLTVVPSYLLHKFKWYSRFVPRPVDATDSPPIIKSDIDAVRSISMDLKEKKKSVKSNRYKNKKLVSNIQKIIIISSKEKKRKKIRKKNTAHHQI
jgi:hypothetical protein